MHSLYDEGQTERFFFMASFDLTRTRMEDRFAQLRFFFFPSPLGLRGRRGRGSPFFFFFGAPARRGATVWGGVVKRSKDAPCAAQMRILGLGSIKARKHVHVHVHRVRGSIYLL